MDRTFDRVSLGAFLHTRRTALQPEDVGLIRGQRRRAAGLRREEVADLCTMSADYFARLERGDGPQPSEQMVAAIARGRVTRDGPDSEAAELADTLQRVSDEFAGLWERHEVGLRWSDIKRFVHPHVGRLDIYCQLLLEPDQGQSLLIFTATPGTESHEKLALLTVLGTDRFTARLQ